MRHKILFFIILLLGFSLRLYFVLASPYSKSSVHTCDISTIGLMAKHILEGKFPHFFYGQYYLGPLEAIVTSIFFIIFGIKIHIIYLSVLLFSILFMISTYYLGKILVGRTAGLIALIYTAFPPSFFFGESVTPAGYHIEIPFLGNLLFIVTLLICKGRRYIYYIILGILAGIGFWTHYIILYYLLAVGIYLLLHERIRILLRNGILTVISAIAVSLPFWIFTIQNDFCTFKFPSGSSRRYDIAFKAFFDKFISMLRLEAWRTSTLQLIIVVFYIIMIIYYIRYSKCSILNLFFFSTLGLYIFYSSNMYAGGAWWYLIPLISFLPISFAYFYNWLNRWNRLVGTSIVIFIISFNLWDIFGLIERDIAESKENQNKYFSRIEFLEENNLYKIIGDDRELRNIEFLSVEKIIGTGFIDGDYFPHEDEVEASNRIAFETSGVDFTPSLNNICKGYRYEGGLYFDFEPFPYIVRSISPSSSNPSLIDLGRIYKICRILILDPPNYIKDFEVEVSKDGYNWKEVAYIENPTTLFWSGPRLYWHPVSGRVECFFEPTEARFIRSAYPGDIFIYEYLGNRPFYYRDYIKEIKEIFKFLNKKGILFVYADYWPSAQIRKLSKGKIDALVPYNTWKPFRKDMNRDAILNKDRAVIVAREDAEELEGILDESNINFKKKIFDRYICYYFPYVEEGISYFIWTGIGLARFYPEIESFISFENGVRFLGYSINDKKAILDKNIKIEYFWEVLDELPDRLSVFVYFMKDEKIVFQNDHAFLHQCPGAVNPLPLKRFRETLRLAIPKDAEIGIYEIVIGLWDERRQRRVLIADPGGKKRTREKIGECKVDFQ